MNDPSASEDGDDNMRYFTSESSDFSGDDASSNSDDGRDSIQNLKKYQDDCFESPLQSLEADSYNASRFYSSKYLDQGMDAILLAEGVKTNEDPTNKTIKAATLKLSSKQILGQRLLLNREHSFSAGSLPALTSPTSGSKSPLHLLPPLFPNTSATAYQGGRISPPEKSEGTGYLEHFSAGITNDNADKLELRRRKRRYHRLRALERDYKSDSRIFDYSPLSPTSTEENVEETKPFLRLSPFPTNTTNQRPGHHSQICIGGHLVDIASERIQFYKSFTHLIRLGSREKQNRENKFDRLDTTEEELPPKELKFFLWMELMAWHKGCSLEHQEAILCLQRQAIPSTLEDILNFYVQDSPELVNSKKCTESVSNLQNISVTETKKKTENISVCASVLDCVRKISVDECSRRNATSDDIQKRRRKISAVFEFPDRSGLKPKCESGLQLYKRKISEVGEAKSMQKVVECFEKTQIDSSDENTSESSVVSNQSNDDSGLSSVIINEPNCECSDTLSRVCQNCVDKETEALEQVINVMNKVDKIEHLYPSSQSLADSYPIYASDEFLCKIKTLNLWYNIIKDLRQKIDLVAKLFGIKNRMKVGWPCYNTDNANELEENIVIRDEGEKVKSVLKLVHFKILTPVTSSPSSSGSDWSERSKSSIPASPDVQLGNPFETPSSSINSGSHPLRSYAESYHGSSHSIYRRYVDHTLRQKGLKHIYRQLFGLLRPILYRVHATLKKPKPMSYAEAAAKVVTDPPSPSGKTADSSLPFKREYYDELSMYGVWSETFQLMALPTFHRPFFFLMRVLLDVVHECLLLRLDQQPEKPSSLSVGQLIKECKEVLRAATQTRQRYINLAQTVLGEGGSEIIEAQLDAFDGDLKKMLEVYLEYLEHRVLMMQRISQITLHQKSYLEEEWSFVRATCPHIPGGEALAAKKFCFMSRYLLSSIGDFLGSGINDCIAFFYENTESHHNDPSTYRKSILQACRKFKHVFHESSERGRQVITFAKSLRKDLEIATEFKLLVPPEELLLKLKETSHIRVISPHSSSHVMFVPGNLQHCETYIWQLVDMTCGHEVLDPGSDQAIYLIMMRCDKCELQGTYWEGPTIVLEPTAEATITLSHVEVDGLLLVVNHSSQLMAQCRKFQRVMGSTLQVDKQQTSCNHAIAEALGDLKSEALELCEKLTKVVKEVEEKLDVNSLPGLDDLDRAALQARCREVLHQGYRFGFEYQKAVTRLITGEARIKFCCGLASFAQQWMKFVANRCEQGRGLRPRWAKQGLEFLVTAYDLPCIQAMSEDEFEELKQSLNDCIRHLLGCSEKSPITSQVISSPKLGSRYSARTPLSSSISWYRSQSFSTSRSDSLLSSPPITTLEEWMPRKKSKEETVSPENISKTEIEDDVPPIERVRRGIEELERKHQEKLEAKSAIGRVSDIIMQQTPLHISARRVTFPWQRCFKIGEGRFGKVYTAVNNITGELIAMKEIHLQPNDHRAVKEAMDEIRTFEGIKHQNLVRYYGVELHREEMLIFMEYCNEGSLESAAQLQLPESLVRKYTRQLLEAVNVLHEHGIVHRDIKSANIFLTSDGNLKLGDFGCCIKLKNNTTLPGELCGFVGTPAYMAPEVFTKNIKEGHGRAADIWSVGCVVLEMVTALRPWHELENSYQIMFTVGMGGVPEIPDSLSDEGKDFLGHCLLYNPQERWTASQLLDHPFTKVQEEEYS